MSVRRSVDVSWPVLADPLASTGARYHFMVSRANECEASAHLGGDLRPARPFGHSLDGDRGPLASLGADRSEGRGSRVRFLLKGAEAVLHRPHPRPDTNKGAVVFVREFLKMAGIEP